MDDKTILDVVYSTAEDLHKAGLITDEVLRQFEVITKSQKAEIDQLIKLIKLAKAGWQSGTADE
jgi:hypothetical protein